MGADVFIHEIFPSAEEFAHYSPTISTCRFEPPGQLRSDFEQIENTIEFTR
jgi:hypothetical protein